MKYVINKDTNIEELYDFIQDNLSFSKVIKLYKLLKHKMETLDDEPKMTIYGADVEVEDENN